MKSNPIKTMMVLVFGTGVLYLIFQKEYLIHIMIALSVIAVFSPFLSRKIEWIWFKIAEILGAIIPKILLAGVFYLVLFPTSLLRRIFSNRDPLMIRKKYPSSFREVNKKFDKEDFVNPW